MPKFPVQAHSLQEAPVSVSTLLSAAQQAQPLQLLCWQTGPATQHSAWPQVQLTPGCPQSCTSVPSPAHRNNGTSCSWISLDWHPAFWPLLATRHYLFPPPVPSTNSFSPGFCCPYSDSCSSHTAWPWTSMPRPLYRLVRRLISEVRTSDSVAQLLVSRASYVAQSNLIALMFLLRRLGGILDHTCKFMHSLIGTWKIYHNLSPMYAEVSIKN